MLVCVSSHYFCTRDRGCSVHPAFPAPSFFEGGKFKAKLARNARRDREAVVEAVFIDRTVAWAKRSVPTIWDDGVSIDGGHGASASLPTLRSLHSLLLRRRFRFRAGRGAAAGQKSQRQSADR